ncbi:unnamed protein product [[Candida] boidinii]|nr:unnamed protein product [[Candida] boidinii]
MSIQQQQQQQSAHNLNLAYTPPLSDASSTASSTANNDSILVTPASATFPNFPTPLPQEQQPLQPQLQQRYTSMPLVPVLNQQHLLQAHASFQLANPLLGFQQQFPQVQNTPQLIYPSPVELENDPNLTSSSNQFLVSNATFPSTPSSFSTVSTTLQSSNNIQTSPYASSVDSNDEYCELSHEMKQNNDNLGTILDEQISASPISYPTLMISNEQNDHSHSHSSYNSETISSKKSPKSLISSSSVMPRTAKLICPYSDCKYKSAFSSKDYLRRHIKEQHKKRQVHYCCGIDPETGKKWGCGKGFKRPYQLVNHWKGARSLGKCQLPEYQLKKYNII